MFYKMIYNDFQICLPSCMVWHQIVPKGTTKRQPTTRAETLSSPTMAIITAFLNATSSLETSLCGKVRKTTAGAIQPHVRLYGSWEVEPIKDWNSYSSIMHVIQHTLLNC